MKNLKIFENEKFGEIRTIIGKDGEIWFVGKDVADVLQYSNTRDALARHVDKEDKSDVAIHDGRQNRKQTIINESGLYSLIFSSKMKKAKEFKRWVTSEVLPAIRKDGGYMMAKEEESEDELMARALIIANKSLERLELKTRQQEQMIGELKPKADYTDRILNSKAVVTITSIAKDYGMSGNKLNKLLHELGVQYKQGKQWLLYARYHDKGYTHSETIEFRRNNGLNDVNMITKWTQKGRLFLYNLLKDEGILPVIEKE